MVFRILQMAATSESVMQTTTCFITQDIDMRPSQILFYMLAKKLAFKTVIRKGREFKNSWKKNQLVGVIFTGFLDPSVVWDA